MPRRYHLRPVKSHQPPALGFCNETGKELHLHEIVDLLTDPLKGQTTTPTILVVHARGVEGGDEARLKAMGINMYVPRRASAYYADICLVMRFSATRSTHKPSPQMYARCQRAKPGPYRK